MSETVLPVKCELRSWAEVDDMFEALKKKFHSEGGTRLRAEVVTSLMGGRLTVVFDWDDMG
jgi:hypothetical protein